MSATSCEPGYLTPNAPYGFCPGCSHSTVTDALGSALSLLRLDPLRTVVVSDIGCVGLIDKHLVVHTFHGLHGRSITYATGLKLARPELDVLVAIGDGGCGIGGAHLVSAARRDLDLTVLVFDNFNYGMTGGEHSATTPLGAKTSSTPMGNDEPALDLCALASAAGGTFVARKAAFDKDLPEVIARAVRHPGFALVDIWEICTAYFMPNNEFRKSELLALAETSGSAFGVLRESPRLHRPAPLPAPSGPVELSASWTSPLPRPTSFLFAGSAGQKVKSAATSFGRAAIRSGLHATQKDDYPITVKTGHSVAEMILSPREIRFTGVEAPDVALVLSADGLSRTRRQLEAMPIGGTLFLDVALPPPETAATLVRIDLAAGTKSAGRENLVLWALARVLSETGLFPVAAFRDTVERFTSAKYRKGAVLAVEAGGGTSS